MRSYSTPESAHLGEVTKLAIAEALVSVALYIGICTYIGSWRSLSLIVVGAPLMLFRTEVSAEWALGYWMRWFTLTEDVFREGVEPSLKTSVIAFGYVLVTPVVGIVLRLAGTIYWAVRMPLYTLKETPRNWFRQTLCTDFMHPPEIVPMESLNARVMKHSLYTHLLVGVLETKGVGWKIFALVLSSPILLIGYFPSAVYRVSFKATSIVYAPFIWAARSTIRTPLPLKLRLERITKSELEKVRRGFSWMVIGSFAAKAGLVLGLVDPKVLTEKFASVRTAELFLVPNGWPWWQLTLLTDAVLTFILLFFADAALARHDGSHPWPERTVLDVTSTISFVRVTLSILTIAHFFGVALHIAFPAVAWPW
jgi:hypothetical protein